MALGAVLIWCLVGFLLNNVPWMSACASKQAPYHPETMCASEACQRTADQIISKIDKDVNPCSSFFNFACGKFVKEATIPDDQFSLGTTDLLKNQMKEQIKRALEEEGPPNELDAFKLVKKFYKACMNEAAIEKKGLSPLLEILRKIGTWPAFQGVLWSEEDFNWMDAIYKINDAGFDETFLLPLDVGIDRMDNTDKLRLMLTRPTHEVVMTDKILEAYHHLIVEVAVLLGADESYFKEEIKEAMSFERALKDYPYAVYAKQSMTVAELTKKFPSIPWREYFRRLLPKNITVDDNEEIFLQDSNYLVHFEKVLNQTPKKTQANYLLYQIILYFIPFLNAEVRQKHLELRNSLFGVSKLSPRWLQCLEIIPKHMPASVAGLYVRKHFQKESKQKAIEMFENMKKEFRVLLQNSSAWLDEESSKHAVEKLDAMTSQMGYPEEILNDAKLEEFHRGLIIDEDNFFHSFLNVTRAKKIFFFNNLQASVNESFISIDKIDFFEAYHTYTENRIYVPFGIVGTAFDSGFPNYLNYARLGWIIGYGIAQGFYNTGRHHDKNGYLVNWWSPAIISEYHFRTKCTKRRYSGFYVKGVGYLNSEQTVEDDLADSAGINMAYLAYQSWAKHNGLEAGLPGLLYSPNQLFWISAANSMCRVERKESLSTKMSIPDSFSPSEFRVEGAFMNSHEFANDFNCEGLFVYMNPFLKCAVN